MRVPAIVFLILVSCFARGQSVFSSLPSNIDKQAHYLFYVHGAIVQDQGVNAVSKDFGPYKYLDIVDSLSKRGFIVISEARPKDTEAESYAEKISKQVDSLLNAGVNASHITVVGASSGAHLVTNAASKLKNPNLNFVVMGMCWPDTYKDYKDKDLCGNFLSIYESSDPHCSCRAVFVGKKCSGNFKEIQLHMGNSHGFIYRPFKEWIDPVIDWANGKK